jgi:HK97 family phage major capsid protein
MTLFGKPVVLVDDAALPVIGDFSYVRINYDIGTTYDTDKDVDAGIYKFVLTAWYDIKLRLSSAFRIAEVTQGP